MDTNAESLCKQLEDFSPSLFGTKEYFSYDGITLYSNSREGNDGRFIYVTNFSEVEGKKPLSNASCYVCINDSGKEIKKTPWSEFPMILVSGDSDIGEVFDRLLRNFFNRSKCERSFKEHMIDLVANGANLETLLKEATKEYDNPFIVFDSNFSLVAHSVPPTLDIPQAQSVVNNKYANVDVLQKLADEGFMETFQHSTRPTLVKLPNGYEKLTVSLFDKMECVGVMSFYNYIRKFEESDYEIVYYMAKLVRTYFQRNTYASSVWTPYDYIFNYLLANEGPINPKVIKDLDVSFPQNMKIMTISLENSSQMQNIPLKFIENSVKKMLPKVHSYIHCQNVIFLCKTSSLDLEQNEKFFEKFSEFLSKYHLFAGISNNFSDLSDFKNAYEESVAAATIGSGLSFEKPYFFYVDYTVFHMLKLFGSENNIKKFCHPAFKTLYKYDLKYNTKYTECLLVYLKYNGNLTECANYFSIHYNSIKYRMRVIQDVCGIDIHDTNTFIHLNLSYMIFKLFDNEQKIVTKIIPEDENTKEKNTGF